MTSEVPVQSNDEIKDPYQHYNYHEYFAHPHEYMSQMSYLQNPNMIDKHSDSSISSSGHNHHTQTLEIPNKPVLVCHFPNSYVDPESLRFRQTRVVRIPREFHTYGDIVPQFSTYYPGNEPGALHTLGWTLRQQEKKAKDLGIDNTSQEQEQEQQEQRTWMAPVKHPLEPYISPAELEYVVRNVNQILKDALWPYNWKNCLETFIQLVTCFTAGYFIQLIMTIVSIISTKPGTAESKATDNYSSSSFPISHQNNRRFRTVPFASAQIIEAYGSETPTVSRYPTHANWHLQRLEEFIKDVNLKLQGKAVFISPFRSAYLSLDIEIPSPIPGEKYEE